METNKKGITKRIQSDMQLDLSLDWGSIWIFNEYLLYIYELLYKELYRGKTIIKTTNYESLS